MGQRILQNDVKTYLNAPSTLQRRPKTLQNRPETLQDDPKHSKTMTKLLQYDHEAL